MALRYFTRRSAPTDEQPESQAEIEEQLKAARKYGASIGADDKPTSSNDTSSATADASTESSTAVDANADPFPDPTVLSDEDERFLERVASAADSAPLPWGDGTTSDEQEQAAVTDAASNTPLPADAEVPGDESNKRKGWLPSMPQVPSMPGVPNMPNMPNMPQGYGLKSLPALPSFRRTGAPAAKRQKSVDGSSPPTASATEDGSASTEDPAATDEATQEQEKRNITSLLSRLDLSVSSLNNRVISLSAPSKKLLADFNNIIKDIVNGAPTAYDDLEKFMTQRQGQIEGLYESMPPFLQSLVSSLPMRMAAGLGPQAAAAVGAGMSGGGSGASTQSQSSSQGSSGGSKQKRQQSYVPSLRSLVAERGAVATMLRSIISFLESRFPMLLSGTNVLMSLALFLLMFVFYYCHKRGRETRMAQEGLRSDIDDMNDDALKRYREAQAEKAGRAGAASDEKVASEGNDAKVADEGDDTNVLESEKQAQEGALPPSTTETQSLPTSDEKSSTEADPAPVQATAAEAQSAVAAGLTSTDDTAAEEEPPKVGRVATNEGS